MWLYLVSVGARQNYSKISSSLQPKIYADLKRHLFLDLRKFLVAERRKFRSNFVWHQLKRDKAAFTSHGILIKRSLLGLLILDYHAATVCVLLNRLLQWIDTILVSILKTLCKTKYPQKHMHWLLYKEILILSC